VDNPSECFGGKPVKGLWVQHFQLYQKILTLTFSLAKALTQID